MNFTLIQLEPKGVFDLCCGSKFKTVLYFRHDIPDQGLERDFDISVDLTMTSVIYTHTKRFPIEIINFLQDILEHHDSIGHMRAASQGQQVRNL